MRAVGEHLEGPLAGRGVFLLLGGMAVGATVSLLTAPQSGARTRRQITRMAEDVTEQATTWYASMADSVAELRRGVRRKVALGRK